MEINKYKAQIEAMLFASGEPVSAVKLAELLEVEEETIRQVVTLMKDDYEAEERGILLISLGESFQLVTKDCYAGVVRSALEIRKKHSAFAGSDGSSFYYRL